MNTQRQDPEPAAGRSAPLDRDRLVQATLELLAEQGPEAFSMRGLAARLGVKSPSLYWHVTSKDELLDLVVDHVLGTCPLPGRSRSGWPRALAAFTRNLRGTILDHPGVAPLLVGRVPLGPNGLRLADSMIGLLRRSGFTEQLASDTYTIMVFYAAGFAIQEITFGRGSQATARLEQVNKTLAALPPGQYPNLVTTSLAQPGRLARRFELGLTDLIQGLQQRIKAASQTAPAATRP